MEELEAVQTLLDMQSLDLAEPVQLAAPPEFQGPEVNMNSDAMDKITGHFDACSAGKLKTLDAMDQVIEMDNETSHVETHTGKWTKQGSKPHTGMPDVIKTFYVETPTLKECHVCITPLETIILVNPKRNQRRK